MFLLVKALPKTEEARAHSPSIGDQSNITTFPDARADGELEYVKRAAYRSQDFDHFGAAQLERVCVCIHSVALEVRLGRAEEVLVGSTVGQAFDYCARKELGPSTELQATTPLPRFVDADFASQQAWVAKAAARHADVKVDPKNKGSIRRVTRCIDQLARTATESGLDKTTVDDQFGLCAVFEESGDLPENGIPRLGG